MPLVNFERLGPRHAIRLDWFHQRAGSTTGYPEPLDDGSFLVTRPKGIYKPKGWEYALSVRINRDSPYVDGEIYHRDDGTWYFSYHQENRDPAQRDREYTNRALMRCIEDRVPVGVLRERVPDDENPDTYDVLGVAVPVGWDAGYFLFEGTRPDGLWHVRDTAGDLLVATAKRELERSAEAPPADDYEARLKLVRQIVVRHGPPVLRSALLDEYAGRCAVTGTDVESVLEAAYIHPQHGSHADRVTNGLPLRADIRALFDLALIAVDPSHRTIAVSKTLAGSEYAQLDGRPLAAPRTHRATPSRDVLEPAWARFMAAEAAR